MAETADAKQGILGAAITLILDLGLAPPEITEDGVALRNGMQTEALGEGDARVLDIPPDDGLNTRSVSSGGFLAPPAKKMSYSILRRRKESSSSVSSSSMVTGSRNSHESGQRGLGYCRNIA